MTRLVYLVFAVLLVQHVDAQNLTYNESSVRAIAPPVKVRPSAITQKWGTKLQHLEAPAPGGSSYQSFLMRQKEQAQPSGKGNTTLVNGTYKNSAPQPALGSSFNGNNFGGAPNDNDVAISNGGKLITVINSEMAAYDVVADTLMFTIDLFTFADTLGLTASMYDPRAAYDPKEDKFILVWLSGNSDSTSNIVLAFSETNDPAGDWNLYYIPGDMLDGQTWTDYPMIAITDNEFILTGNALVNDSINTSDSWKYLFKESLIWQIDKNSGYQGDSLKFKFYTNIRYNNAPIRNLCPIQGGSTTVGPEFYLVSNRNFDVVNDTFFVLKVTGLYNNPATAIQVQVVVADVPYGLAPDAKQSNTLFLQVNDSRVLDGYIEYGVIHFVGNTILPDSALCGVYHGQVNVGNGSYDFTGKIIGDYNLNFAYPAISHTGKSVYDDEAIISFNYCSVDSFPGVSAVYYDGATQSYSDRLTIKAGTSFVNVISGSYERWGDYSGNQRKYNQPGTVWISGFYGLLRSQVVPRNVNATWIAELTSPDLSSAQMVDAPSNIQAYPNPTTDKVYIDFESPKDKWVDIALYSLSGQLVKTFIRDEVKPGKNQFSFSVSRLSAGTYILRITGNERPIATQKIVVGVE